MIFDWLAGKLIQRLDVCGKMELSFQKTKMCQGQQLQLISDF